MNTKLTIQIDLEGEYKFPTSPAYPLIDNEVPYGEAIAFTYSDVSDFNIHQLFCVFEKVARSLGYSEETIMRGACQVAFNDCRDPQTMKKVAKEYELEGEF